MDLLGAFVEHDEAVRSALAAAFQAHGERVDPDVAGMAIGHPGLQGIYRVFQWLYPIERLNDSAVKSIHELAVKELQRLVRFGGAIQPSSSLVRLCEMWMRTGLQVAATTTPDARVVKVLLHRLGWDETPPFWRPLRFWTRRRTSRDFGLCPSIPTWNSKTKLRGSWRGLEGKFGPRLG